MTNLTIVYPDKMEYGLNFSNYGLKMMVKSRLEKIFLKFLHAFFIPPDLLHKSEDLGLKIQIKLSNKMTFFAHGGISIKIYVMHVHIHNK